MTLRATGRRLRSVAAAAGRPRIRQVSMDQVLGDSRVAMLPDPFQAQLNATMKKFNDALDKCAVAKDVF